MKEEVIPDRVPLCILKTKMEILHEKFPRAEISDLSSRATWEARVDLPE